MKCRVCGAEIPKETRICPYCDSEVEIKIPEGSIERILWDVELTETGPEAIKAIKIIRELTGTGLKEAKDLSDNVPSLIVKAVDRERAETIKNRFEEIGAEVTLFEKRVIEEVKPVEKHNEPGIVTPEPVQKTSSKSGKEYSFKSSSGQNIFSIFGGHITTTVRFDSDRLYISAKPERFAKIPVIFYDDITSLKISTSVNFYYIIYIAVSVIAAFVNPLFLIATLLLVVAGLEKKIRITQRNGRDVIIYAHSGDVAAFKTDISSVAKI